MIILVMGTTGAGKTTVGKLLAQQLAWRFVEGDDFHSAANVDKMQRGIPLSDADRAPWLEATHQELLRLKNDGHHAVVACSALKQRYREQLSVGIDWKIVYLKAPIDVVRERLQSRTGHFADESILADQFAQLEEPSDALTVNAIGAAEEIVAEVCAQVNLASRHTIQASARIKLARR